MSVQSNIPQDAVEVVKDVEEFDFGFDAEYVEYKTISGKEQLPIDDLVGFTLSDIEVGATISGYPEVTIFNNEKKDENGEYERNYQSVRIRIMDEQDYVDLYANIPRRDQNGFIEGINKSFGFFRTGFDLCFSFMRYLNEANVVDDNGEINRINKINIENVCKKIDSMDFVTFKVVKGADDKYDSFILLDMKNI